MITWLHNNIPQAILFEFGPLKIYWYGFLMVVGGLIGMLVVLKLIKYYDLKKDDVFNLAFWWIVAGVLGGRIYYVLYSFGYYKNHLSEIVQIWHGGLAIHGVMLGGFVATYIYCRRHKINFWKLADVVAAGLVIAQVVGRWGNYFNQEIFGKPTDLAWGIPIESWHRPIEYVPSEYFHPTFLYESLCNLIIFIDLTLLHWIKITKKKLFDGLIFCYYLVAYSVLRFCLEFLRIDDSPLFFGIRWAQIYSVLLMIFSFVLMFVLYKKNKREQICQ